jgi:hypothetical protein
MMDDKRWDREVMKRVQAVERQVPPDLETAFLREIQAITPRPPRQQKPRAFYYGALAAAAAVLLVVLFFLFPLFHRHIDSAGADEVWVQDAWVEGKPASTFFVNSTNPDITIVWIEKIEEKIENKLENKEE